MQSRFLVRARNLAAYRRALIERSLEGTVQATRRRIVLVPTQAAAELLRQSVERAGRRADRPATVLPDVVTRQEWLIRLHDALADTPPLLTRTEREVLLARAAQETASRRPRPGHAFDGRPGLVAAMLSFYDDVRRRGRSVRRLARALFDELRVERGTDRGSEGLIQQTIFLGFTFLAYERARSASGRLDEHALRTRLLHEQPRLPFDHLIVAVGDHPSDPRGLWPADFDLAGRLRHLARIDVVTTDETHDAGFRDRIERELPGVDEQRAPDVPSAPALVVPGDGEARSGAGGRSDRAGPDRGREDGDALPVFVSRDREEEVRDVARAIRATAARTDGELREPVAIVFQRPLPYLYLTQQVLAEASVPFQLFDALPLAAEPYAALLDLVLAVARTGGTREASVALLRSPHARFDVDGHAVTPADAAALDAVLAERRVTGDAATYVGEIDAFFGTASSRARIDAVRARRAAAAAGATGQALAAYRSAPTASAQVETLVVFLRAHERLQDLRDPAWERYFRGRAAVLAALEGLADAYRLHHDAPREHEQLTAAIHHAIEAHTFAPRRGHGGVHVVDSVAARFGEFDHVYLVGLVESDWPEHAGRTIFYASGLLKALGWPQEPEAMRARQASFRDLLTLPALSLRLSAFQLDGDALVGLSPIVETIRRTASGSRPPRSQPGDERRPVVPARRERLFADELLTLPDVPEGLDAETAEWLALRRRRPPLSDPSYSGIVAPPDARAYRVSAVDQYVTCPFKYFSEHVLGLPEEREDTTGLSPLARGTLLHSLFEQFYRTWQATRGGAITALTLPDAVALFTDITRQALSALPAPDRVLEETRLLGSIVGRGVAERVFEIEVDADVDVADRLLEEDLRGTFTFPLLSGLRQRPIDIRGKADRIDVLAGGALRVVDYKLGRQPDPQTSIQVAVYAHCARQRLEARDGHPHPVASAAYLAFGDDRRLEGRVGTAAQPVAMAVEARASAFAMKVDQIEAGVFPPRPRRPAECQWCQYAGVCRKEYKIESDEPVESL